MAIVLLVSRLPRRRFPPVRLALLLAASFPVAAVVEEVVPPMVASRLGAEKAVVSCPGANCCGWPCTFGT